MDVLILGSGGREDAIGRQVRKSPLCGKLYFLPGNGGTACYGENIPGSVMDTELVVRTAKEKGVGFVIVTPDDPLAAGTVDALAREGIKAFGPDRAAARIESSKSFAKDLMKRHGIPTASYEVFTSLDDAIGYLADAEYPIVIKADGLALGKGVVIAGSFSEAEDAARSMLAEGRFGAAGSRIVIEEFLTGPEVTVLAFTDGSAIKPMVSSMDHKRAYDGDRGPNTGGMGVIAPNPYYTEEIAAECMDRIFIPTIRAMAEEGCPFRGCLYFGLMLTPQGPKVIEYNSRFGDPETEALMPLMESDLLEAMLATADGTLADADVRFSDMSSCCVVAASGGYPGSYRKGMEIAMPSEGTVYIAGAERRDGRLCTSGGRVLAAAAVGKTLREAIDAAYSIIGGISFDGMEYRKDIGRKALEAFDGNKSL